MKIILDKNEYVEILSGEYHNQAEVMYGKIDTRSDNDNLFHTDLEDVFDWFGYDFKSSIDDIYEIMYHKELYINIEKNQNGVVKYSLCDEETREEISSARTLNELIQQILTHADELNV